MSTKVPSEMVIACASGDSVVGGSEISATVASGACPALETPTGSTGESPVEQAKERRENERIITGLRMASLLRNTAGLRMFKQDCNSRATHR
jgi:hypothetical protein